MSPAVQDEAAAQKPAAAAPPKTDKKAAKKGKASQDASAYPLEVFLSPVNSIVKRTIHSPCLPIVVA